MPDIAEERLEKAEKVIDSLPIEKLKASIKNTQYFEWAFEDVTQENEIRRIAKSLLYEDYSYVRPFIRSILASHLNSGVKYEDSPS